MLLTRVAITAFNLTFTNEHLGAETRLTALRVQKGYRNGRSRPSHCRFYHFCRFGQRARLFEEGGDVWYRILPELLIGPDLAEHGTSRIMGCAVAM